MHFPSTFATEHRRIHKAAETHELSMHDRVLVYWHPITHPSLRSDEAGEMNLAIGSEVRTKLFSGQPMSIAYV